MRAWKSDRAARWAALSLVGGLAAWGASTAVGAAVQPKNGTYKGSTQQPTVVKAQRGIEFKVKGRRIILTKEPLVALGACVTPPTFIEEPGQTVKSRISGGGTFSFTRTFLGSKFDKISGRFDSETRIEGEATYHFPSSATCEGGKTTTTFKASLGKK
jgi:hypothetical protein